MRQPFFPGGAAGMSVTPQPRRHSELTPLLHITLPDDDGENRHFAPIVLALEAVIAVNLWHIKRSLKRAEKGEGYPIAPMYMTGVRYKEDPAGREDWRDLFSVMKRGYGDCDNLVAWRCAELRAAGVAAEPVIKWQHLPRELALKLGFPPRIVPSGGLSMVHCLVRFPNGHIEDPSKLLGMGGEYTSRV